MSIFYSDVVSLLLFLYTKNMKRLLTILVVTSLLGLIAWGYIWLDNEKVALDVSDFTSRISGPKGKKTTTGDAMSGSMMSGAVMASGEVVSGGMMKDAAASGEAMVKDAMASGTAK
jgi:hypothetical protein